ncbi:MAG: penicillin acylase family protein [Flavobacteriaceae bacterium]
MRIFKKTLKFLFVIITILCIAGFWYYNHLKPSYSGEVSLANIENETIVYYDDYGIPHIYAENRLDATTTLGYVHAQDRLWQMELMRRISPGRLSEIFGEDLIENDTFFASLGIDEAAEISISKLDKNSEVYKIMEAYLKGVNQYMDEGPTPIEYTLIGLEKKHFVIKDIYNIMGYLSFSFAMAHKTDPLLSSLQLKLGNKYVNELDVSVSPETLYIKNSKQEVESYTTMLSKINTIMETNPIPPFIGSNSWVISEDKTSNGKVILASDPHIGFAQPSVWYEAHLVTPDYEMYGYHMAGIPFAMLGHNRDYAYGITMFENDDIELYREENHPTDKNKYKTPNGYETYKTITKTIKVKDGEDVTFELKSSRHGPIINNTFKGVTEENSIAMSWIYTQLDNKMPYVFHLMSTAKSMEDFKKGASLLHAPGLNLMYGDAKGNIAWYASAKLYKYKSHVNSKFILDGASGEDDIVSYLDFSENPMAENPEWNYVYSANNQPDSIAGMLYPGYYIPEDRAKRITLLLEPKNNWNKTSVSAMINDVTSSVAPEVIKELTNNINYNSYSKNEQRAIDVLQLWDGSHTLDAVAPTIYNKFIYLYLKNTFQDEMGKELYAQFEQTHLIKRQIALQIHKEKSIWWDDTNTSEIVETKKDILSKTLIESVAALETQLGEDMNHWTWNKVHKIEHHHPIGKVESLREFFNVGPFSINGGSEVINNLDYRRDSTGVYNVKSGPSTRRVIDFSDIENSLSINPTGQSGNPLSIHYRDQAEMYNKGEFRKTMMNKEEIIKVSTKVLFTPKQ